MTAKQRAQALTHYKHLIKTYKIMKAEEYLIERLESIAENDAYIDFGENYDAFAKGINCGRKAMAEQIRFCIAQYKKLAEIEREYAEACKGIPEQY